MDSFNQKQRAVVSGSRAPQWLKELGYGTVPKIK